ncbi:beta-lactamase/transpeptidase-like protein [Infundibulicybe gibba]|nr:beta-lactamase/transpeptidase-like protein [Infundibulicybe gibba]
MVNISISSAAKEQIQQVLDDATKNKTMPGLACGITSTDGSCSLRRAGPKSLMIRRVARSTLTRLSGFVLAGLKLIEQGKIQLDTPVAQHLPELAHPVIIEGYSPDGKAVTRPATKAITFQHLLNFTSGLFYSYKPDPTSRLPQRISIVTKRKTRSNPSSRFSSKEHIFSPLGLKSTSFYLTPDLKGRLQPLTFRKPDGTLTRFTDQYELMEHDYTKAGTAKDPILSAQSVASLFEPSLPDAGVNSLSKRLLVPGMQWQWSTGLCISHLTIAGGGWANTSYFLDPSSGIAAVLGTQLVPATDVTKASLWDKIERLIYAGLEGSK